MDTHSVTEIDRYLDEQKTMSDRSSTRNPRRARILNWRLATKMDCKYLYINGLNRTEDRIDRAAM